MDVPSWNCYFGKASFWDERYLQNCENFDWYHNYETLRPLLRKLLNFGDRIMLAGCGTSTMAADMHSDGFESLTNVDVSRVAIAEMMDRYAEISVKPSAAALGTKNVLPDLYNRDAIQKGIRWLQADCTNMKINFEDKCFDVVLDKALLDSFCGAEIPSRSIKKYLNEVERILSPSGTFICISHGLPENRLNILEDTDTESDNFLAWGECTVYSLPKPTLDPYEVPDLLNFRELYYVYICTKTPELDAKKDRILAKQKQGALCANNGVRGTSTQQQKKKKRNKSQIIKK